MLSPATFFVFTSVLAGFAAAQSSQNSTGFNPESVDLSTRNSWCAGQRENCPKLCGGPAGFDKQVCYGQTLEYECMCKNGTGPADIDQYLDTLPNHICQATFAQCRQQNPGSDACIECGELQANDVPTASASASSSAAASTAAATSTESAPAAAVTDSAANKAVVQGVIGLGAMGVMGVMVL